MTRRWCVAGLALLLACGTAAGGAELSDPTRQAAARVAALEEKLRSRPADARVAGELVAACMASARLTGDPGFYKRAAGAVKVMQAAEPGSPRPHAMMAWVLTGEHRFAAAAEEARAALALAPGDAEASGVLSDALLELGRYDEAERALQTWLDRRPGAAAYSRAAYLRWLRGDQAGADQLLLRAAGAVDPARDPEMAAWLSAQAGDMDAARGDASRAELAYRAALARVPGYLNASAPLGRLLARAGKLDEAAGLLGDCLRRRPTADVAASLEDVERARGKVREADQAAGMVETIHTLMAATGAPGDRAVARADADHRRSLERALTAAEAELQARPDIYSHDAVGWVLLRLGRTAKALEHTALAVALGTPDPMLEAHHGLALAAAGRAADARTVVQRALARGVALDLCLVRDLEACVAALPGGGR